MKHIYISPHADDVALSCGGQIIANPDRCTETMVLTVFTSEAPVAEDRETASKNFASSINDLRNTEDRSAWVSVGVRVEYLDLPEALLRKRFPFAMFSSPGIEPIAGELVRLIRFWIASFPDATFYFPAGFGNHIDHLLCRDAAFQLLDDGSLNRIMFYEDVPYCWLSFIRKPHYRLLMRSVSLDKSSGALAARTDGLNMATYLRRNIVPFPRGRKLFGIVAFSLLLRTCAVVFSFPEKQYDATINPIPLSEDQMSAKKRLLFKYESQLPMLFGDNPESLLEDYSESFSNETIIEVIKTRKKIAHAVGLQKPTA